MLKATCCRLRIVRLSSKYHPHLTKCREDCNYGIVSCIDCNVGHFHSHSACYLCHVVLHQCSETSRDVRNFMVQFRETEKYLSCSFTFQRSMMAGHQFSRSLEHQFIICHQELPAYMSWVVFQFHLTQKYRFYVKGPKRHVPSTPPGFKKLIYHPKYLW